MALTPTDPTKPQVWINGTAPNQTLDFYIPQGPKGDPGGIVLGTNLDSVSNLNIFVTSGVYRQTATPPTGLNYPTLAPGILTVYERIRDASLQSVVQEYQPVSSSNGVPVIYRRYYFGNATWTAWRATVSTRTDQSAGRVMYAWDDTNSREQIIYGDTGDRDVRTDLGNGTFSALKLRRMGGSVMLTGVGWVPPANATGNTLLAALPIGFRNNHTTPVAVSDNTTGTLMLGVLASAGASLAIGGNLAARNYNFTAVWLTTDTWPTTLPGVASGGIPTV